MAIDKQFIVHLKGRDYPLWAGVLAAATEAGLISLTTQIVQIPTVENGHMAVVTARAEFADGRVFVDVGDCSPASTTPQLAAASLRLASTRAKGRALRDAINCGQTLWDELPGGEPTSDDYSAVPDLDQTAPTSSGDGLLECSHEACEAILTKGQYDFSTRKFGRGLCPHHQKGTAAVG